MGRYGIFGGTFDPPHIGHLVLAAEAKDQLDLDKILWVLTPQPPHKPDQPIIPLTNRLEMVQAAIRDEPAFELSRVDIDRSPPHYALDTMHILRTLYPETSLYYLMGGDSLHDLPGWHRPQEFVAACDGIGVMLRPGVLIDVANLNQQVPGVAEKVCFVGTPLLEISASDIRKRVAQGRPFRYYVPGTVYALIQKHKYYTSEQLG